MILNVFFGNGGAYVFQVSPRLRSERNDVKSFSRFACCFVRGFWVAHIPSDSISLHWAVDSTRSRHHVALTIITHRSRIYDTYVIFCSFRRSTNSQQYTVRRPLCDLPIVCVKIKANVRTCTRLAHSI